jgi:hypothetical protein
MSMIAGIGGEPVANSGPGFSLDQRRMLAGVEFALMRYLTSVNLVRQQPSTASDTLASKVIGSAKYLG